MNLKNITRTSTAAGVLASVMALGLASPAASAAASVPAWRLVLCSKGSFQTNFYYSTGGSTSVPAGTCKNRDFQGTSASSYVVEVKAYVNNGGYIASAVVDIASRGVTIETHGSSASPRFTWF